MMKMKKKTLTLVAAVSLWTSCFGCWYCKSNYTDYIYTINDKVVNEQSTNASGVCSYTVRNNQVVDFPLTVSMRLISKDTIDLNDGSKTDYCREIVGGRLQYRILPGGNWTTVQQQTQPMGYISKDSAPGTFFGNNNIWPKGLKAGTVIMIRLYVTDGMWQSGTLANACSDKLTTVSTQYGDRTSLPDSFQYSLDGTELLANDLGGAWYPHFCVTVVYSGSERPIR